MAKPRKRPKKRPKKRRGLKGLKRTAKKPLALAPRIMSTGAGKEGKEGKTVAVKASRPSKARKKVLVTAALPYINNIPHLGHIVGSHLPADIFARFCRAKGFDTLFVGGSDENGTPVEIAASELRISVQEFSDVVWQEHKRIYDWFNISYDNFSRTSREVHHKTTKEFFSRIYNNGYIEEGEIEMFYCPKDERFLPDRYVIGTCAKCGYGFSFGDQCEKCGCILDSSSLIEPHCKICGSRPVLRKSRHLFLRIDKLSGKIDKWLRENRKLKLQVRNLALGWIKEGLKKRCITRDLKNGVKVPLKGFENKVFYVWFDAPIGYISSTKEATALWKDFWQGKDSEIVHFLGKDNIPFHTIFWPGMLIANGRFNLPANVAGLQYLNYEGGKFSKTKKHGVFCEKLPESGIDADVLRAYLIFLIPETGDTEFKWQEFQDRINNDIIGNFANFINRTLSLIYSYSEGEIIKPEDADFSALDRKFLKDIYEKFRKIDELLSNTELRVAFLEIINLAALGNKYFDYNKLWQLARDNKDVAKKKLYLCASLCRTLAVLASPYLPDTAARIWKQLNLKGRADEKGKWDSAAELAIPARHKINKPFILFNKLTPEFIEEFKRKVTDVSEIRELFSEKK